MHFLDVDVAEGQKTQKAFDERFGLGKGKFVNCDVSRCDELESTYIPFFVHIFLLFFLYIKLSSKK